MRSIMHERPMKRSISYKVVYGLQYLSGNKLPYFSVTVDAPDKMNVSTGASHDDVLKYHRDMKDIVALHLSDVYGEPMHSFSNAWYQLSEYDGRGVSYYPHQEGYSLTPQQRAEKYLRAPAGYLDDVPTFKMTGEIYPVEFSERVEALREGWKREADLVIDKYQLYGWDKDRVLG